MTTRSHASTTRQTSYTFDKLGRVKAVDNPSPMGDEEVGYDNYGNQLWKEDGKGIVTLYKYDTLNRVTDVYYNYTGSLTTISYPGTADVSYTYYGGSGIRAKVVDSAGTSKYAYNLLRRMTTYTAPQPSSRSISYTYNNLGQKTSAGYGGMTINYEYFANGWLKAVKKGANLVASYSYDTSGNRTRVDFGNGTYQVFDYDSDPRYRLASIDYAYGCEDDEDIEVRGTLDVTRDKTGNPLTWGNDDYKKGYAYDDNNRLKSADYPGKSTVNWGYDWVGNRLDTGFTYNAADQLTASPGKSYTYDGNGNMLTGTMSFSYTYTDLVATAGNTSMGWDSMGNRMSFTTSGSATYQFVYDPTAGIPAVLEEVVSGTSTYYVREPNGALICRLTGGNLTPAYYHFDELGSTLFLTDPDGILTDKYTYDAWGNVTSHTGTTSQPYQYVGELGYYTHYQESGFKLMQLGVRLYDPEVGRFTQSDPAGDGVNWYGYVEGMSVRFTDPTGLERCEYVPYDQCPWGPGDWVISNCGYSVQCVVDVVCPPIDLHGSWWDDVCAATAPIGGGVGHGIGNVVVGRGRWLCGTSGPLFCSRHGRPPMPRQPGWFNGRLPGIGEHLRLGWWYDKNLGRCRFSFHGGEPIKDSPGHWHRWPWGWPPGWRLWY